MPWIFFKKHARQHCIAGWTHNTAQYWLLLLLRCFPATNPVLKPAKPVETAAVVVTSTTRGKKLREIFEADSRPPLYYTS